MRIFTDYQLKRFANIFDNAGQVLFGASVVTPLISRSPGKDFSLVMVIGLSLTFFLWWVSLRIERNSS